MKYDVPSNVKNGVYCIVNLINRKKYVGSSKSMNARYRKHKELLIKGKHHCRHLQSAVIKHGIENFKFVLLARCEPGLGKYLEKTYLDYGNFEYNSTKQVVFKQAPSLNRFFKPLQVRQIKWLYRKGYSAKSIAEEFGCTDRTIYGIVKRNTYLEVRGLLACPELTNNLDMRVLLNQLSDDEVRSVRHLLGKQYSQRDIAKQLGVSKTMIAEIKRSAGRYAKIPIQGNMCPEVLKIQASVNTKNPKGWGNAKRFNGLVDEAYEKYKLGLNLTKVAKEYGVARHTVKRQFNKRGYTIRNKK